MKILVCGGRNFGKVVRKHANPDDEPAETQDRLAEYKFIHDTLNDLVLIYSKEVNPDDNWLPTDITIISGAASGADSAASDFAVINYCKLEEYPAEWDKHGVRAGYIRNQRMLDDGKPDLVVAFPGGKGTAMMIRIAKKAGIPVREVGYP